MKSWRGWWWLGGKPDNRQPGTLCLLDDGDLKLKLIDGFDTTVVTSIGQGVSESTYGDGNFPMILGSCGNELFTLLDCQERHSHSGMSGNLWDQHISVLRALRGIHLLSPDERVFGSAKVQLEYLLGWMRKTSFSSKVEFKDGRWTGGQTARWGPVDDLKAHHGEFEYTLGVAFHLVRAEDRARANERELANKEWAELKIESEPLVSFNGFDTRIKALMDLMTLTAHAPAGVIAETLEFPASDAHPLGRRERGEVEMFGRKIYSPKPADNETERVDYLFTLQDVEFADVLPKWLELHQKAWLPCSILFGLRYIRDGYTPSRLLSVASAAESLHRELFESDAMPEEQHRVLVKTVMAALAGKDKASKASRKFVSERLQNHMTYKERLEALAAVPDAESVSTLIKDVPSWSKLLKDYRNGVAHADRDRLGEAEAHMTFYLLEGTVALLGLVLLSELGLSAEVQRRAAELPYLTLIVKSLNRALSAGT